MIWLPVTVAMVVVGLIILAGVRTKPEEKYPKPVCDMCANNGEYDVPAQYEDSEGYFYCEKHSIYTDKRLENASV